MRPSDMSNKNPVKFSKEWLPWTSGSAMTGADLAVLMLVEKKVEIKECNGRTTAHHPSQFESLQWEH